MSPRKTPQSWVGRLVVTSVDAALMPADEDLEEVLGGVAAEALHAEVLDDEEVDLRELLDESRLLAGVGLDEVLGEVEGAADEDAVAGADRPHRDGGGDVALADAGRPDQEDVLVGGDEAAAASSASCRSGDLGIEGPVEVR